jgi:hypothetical protein
MPLRETPDPDATPILQPSLLSAPPTPAQGVRQQILKHIVALGLLATQTSFHAPATEQHREPREREEHALGIPEHTSLRNLANGTSLFGKPLRVDIQGKPLHFLIERTDTAFVIGTGGASYEVTEFSIDDLSIPCSPKLLHSTGGTVSMQWENDGVHATCVAFFGMMEIHVEVREEDVIRTLESINTSQDPPEYARIEVCIRRIHGTVEKPNGGTCTVSLRKQQSAPGADLLLTAHTKPRYAGRR